MNGLLIDSTLCIACRACQVACKWWHGLSAEKNDTLPQKLTGTRLTLVKDRVGEVNGKPTIFFFKDQCRHCARPRCLESCPLHAIVKDPDTGAVVITDKCNPDACVKPSGLHPCEEACVYHIPHFDPDSNITRKCDLCYDRINDGSGRGTSCADACPTGAIYFGDLRDVRKEAANRLKEARKKYPKATLYTGTYGRTQVMWLMYDVPATYPME